MSSQTPELRDPRSLRALAHPLRLTLLDLLLRESTLTSTRAAQLTGESSGSCSFHLRQLAKYGFVEEAGNGRGRERRWRAAALGRRWPDLYDDPEAGAAAEALAAQVLERNLASLHRYLRDRTAYPPEWREAALAGDRLVYLRPDELRELNRKLLELVDGYAERTVDPELRPEDARPVEVLAFTFPLPPIPGGS
jgi:DNA-binding transcriptional ArsR family regulator